MMRPFVIGDTFLKKKLSSDSATIEALLQRWSLSDDFLETIDRWFGNFPTTSKELAYKVLLNIDYYGHRRFSARVAELRDHVFRALLGEGYEESELLLVTPPGGGDSSHMHAYELVKAWGLPPEQVCNIIDLQSRVLSNRFLIIFNDTHGSGNQFLDKVWPFFLQLPSKPRAVFLVAIAIAQEAFDKFSKLPGVQIVPDSPSTSAKDIFSNNELNRLSKIGEQVYPKHPLGYSGAALLTAYYFQCPNNTLPIVWADGNNNRVAGRRQYPWYPLFPYRPKVKNAISLLFEEREKEEGELAERLKMLRAIEEIRNFT